MKVDFRGENVLKKCWSQKTFPRGAKRGQLQKKFSKNIDFRLINLKNTENPKLTSKVVKELLIRSYDRFMHFSPTWDLTITKNTSVNQQKFKQHEKMNFNREKNQKIKHLKKTSKLLYKPLIYGYERFKYLFQFEWTRVYENTFFSPGVHY